MKQSFSKNTSIVEKTSMPVLSQLQEKLTEHKKPTSVRMKIKIFIYTLFITVSVSAQDVQLHYDFGKPENGDARNYFVSTFEIFKPDSLGYTFLFADFEFDAQNPSHGVSSGYFEISREFFMPWFRHNNYLKELGFHIEYDGGSAIQTLDSATTIGFNLGKSWLTGFGYPVKIGNFTLNTIILYKYSPGTEAHDAQLTLTWCQMLFKNRVTLSGFADFWTIDNENDNKELVLYAEPQIWFNAYRNFSIGSEFKISKNFFPGSNRVEVFPTLGVMYTF
jgi:hypothetical protein